MEDLKNYMTVSEKAIRKSLSNKNTLGGLHFIASNAAYWKELFTYDESRSALENFLLYRAAGAFNLYAHGVDDADITAPALKHLAQRLSRLPLVTCIKVGKEIAKGEKSRAFLVTLTDGRQLFLESDTANSLLGDLGHFLRILLNRENGQNWADDTYIKSYGLPANWPNYYYKPFKFFYFYSLVSALPHKLQDQVELDCLTALERRAQRTHVLQNMILVPYGYNSPRGFKLSTYQTKKKISDRLDLTFIDFEEMLADTAFADAAFQVRLGNTKCTVDSIRFLVEHKEALFPPIPVCTPKAEGNSLSAILERSKIIIKTLS